MAVKLLRWLIFSVILALVPLGVSWLIQLTHGVSPSLYSLLQHGELLLIAAALSAAATGELIGSGDNLLKGKLVAGGVSLLIVVFSAIYFASISASVVAQSTLDNSVIGASSLIIYISSLVSGGCCCSGQLILATSL